MPFKEFTCNAGDPGSIPGSGDPLNQEDLGSGRSTGEGIGYPLQYSGLENSMDCIVHGVAKSQTLLSDFHMLNASNILQSLCHSMTIALNFP